MSGHLQRMVAAAARPARAVRPLVGGLFIAPPQPAITEESSILFASKPSSHSVSLDFGTRHEADQHAHISPLVDSSNFNPDQPTSHHSAPQTSHISHTEMRFAQQAASTQSSADAGAVPTIGEAKRTPIEARDTTRVAKTKLLLPRQEETLSLSPIRPRLQQAQSTSVHSSSQNAEAEGAEVQAPMQMQRTQELQERAARDRRNEATRPHSTEDIQIHIGRIEVIAVPPQVQRSAPVATRKTESLEDYLRRRDRRLR